MLATLLSAVKTLDSGRLPSRKAHVVAETAGVDHDSDDGAHQRPVPGSNEDWADDLYGIVAIARRLSCSSSSRSGCS